MPEFREEESPASECRMPTPESERLSFLSLLGPDICSGKLSGHSQLNLIDSNTVSFRQKSAVIKPESGQDAAYLVAKSAPVQTAQAEPWTYLVNLTATMMPNNWAGSGYKYNLLKGLKDQTKTSSARIIVQQFDDRGMLSRYEIAGGKLQEFGPVKSNGTAKNLQALIEQAPGKGPIALINQAHGKGDRGFEGDEGSFSVHEFEEAIRQGLANSGRSKLDMLSLDSCLMANVHVLDKLSSVSSNIVASQLEEFSVVTISTTPAFTKFDMQAIDQSIAGMLRTPPRDGKEAASIVFTINNAACDKIAPLENGCGTPTLGIYNPESAPNARRALDGFGSALETALKDEEARKAVDKLIDAMEDVSVNDFHLRDADTFAEGIIKLIEQGEIKDASGNLKKEAEKVLTANRQLVRSFYVNPDTKIVQMKFGDGKTLNGLNVFLPGPDYNIRAEAEELLNSRDAKNLPLEVLLEKQIQASLPDASSGGWANFIRALRAPAQKK